MQNNFAPDIILHHDKSVRSLKSTGMNDATCAASTHSMITNTMSKESDEADAGPMSMGAESSDDAMVQFSSVVQLYIWFLSFFPVFNKKERKAGQLVVFSLVCSRMVCQHGNDSPSGCVIGTGAAVATKPPSNGTSWLSCKFQFRILAISWEQSVMFRLL